MSAELHITIFFSRKNTHQNWEDNIFKLFSTSLGPQNNIMTSNKSSDMDERLSCLSFNSIHCLGFMIEILVSIFGLRRFKIRFKIRETKESMSLCWFLSFSTVWVSTSGQVKGIVIVSPTILLFLRYVIVSVVMENRTSIISKY